MRRLEAKGYKGLEGLAHSEDESKTEAYKVRLVLGALMGADIWSKHGRLSLPKEVMQQPYSVLTSLHTVYCQCRGDMEVY